MSCWKTPMVRMLRNMIGDASAITYSNGDLEETLVYAAFLIHKQFTFLNTYTINLAKLSISPDPVELSDVDFISLVTYKAGTEILFNELKSSATNAVSWKNGPSSFDGVESYKAKQEIYNTLLSQFDEAKANHQLGNIKGRSVMGPFSSEDLTYNINGGIRWLT